jgi:hypothetical protein
MLLFIYTVQPGNVEVGRVRAEHRDELSRPVRWVIIITHRSRIPLM